MESRLDISFEGSSAALVTCGRPLIVAAVSELKDLLCFHGRGQTVHNV